MYPPALATGATAAALSVALGAFAAHKLKTLTSPETVAMFQTGVTYQMYHAFALLLTGLLMASYQGKALTAAYWLFLIGIIFFSGSLYAMTMFKVAGTEVPKWIGPITPVGGLLFIGGWISILLAVLGKKL